MEFEQEEPYSQKKTEGGGASSSPPLNVGWQLLTSATKRKKSLKNMLFYNRIWSWKKWREKRGEGYWKKISTPPYVFENYVFFLNSSLYNVRKKSEAYPKQILLSQKNYLHTFMYAFVAPENYSDFLQNLEVKIQISREKKGAWCTTINFYLQICSKVSYCLMCII